MRFAINFWRMCTSLAPAASFVDITVATDEKVVANVAPFVRKDMVMLNGSHLMRTRSLIVTRRTGRMVRNHVWCWIS